MPLTEEERERIYEEEKARREVQDPKSPTDQLSSCIMGCGWIIVTCIVLAGLLFVGLCIKGALWPVY